MSFKRELYFKMSRIKALAPLTRVLVVLNLLLFHREDRRTQIRRRGAERTWYIIRPAGTTSGLMGEFYRAVSLYKYALSRRYIPYIDFRNYPCQYTVDRPVHGTENVWEYYFRQPERPQLEEGLKKDHVILSGWTLGGESDISLGEKTFTSENEKREFMRKLFPVQEEILSQVDALDRKLFYPRRSGSEEESYGTTNQGGILAPQPGTGTNAKKRSCDEASCADGNCGKILGAFLRGTDYVKLRPSGHHIQPTVEELMGKVSEFLEQYPDIKAIYVVTEDAGYYQRLRERFGGLVFSSDDVFVNAEAEDWLAESLKDDPYERGLRYLHRLLLLERCDYLVTSLAAGSEYVLDMAGDHYQEKYVFDLGRYE